MKYRVILAFETYSVGQVIEPTGLWADELKRRGYIEPIITASARTGEASVPATCSPVQAGAVQTIQPKRGRPRKQANGIT